MRNKWSPLTRAKVSSFITSSGLRQPSLDCWILNCDKSRTRAQHVQSNNHIIMIIKRTSMHSSKLSDKWNYTYYGEASYLRVSQCLIFFVKHQACTLTLIIYHEWRVCDSHNHKQKKAKWLCTSCKNHCDKSLTNQSQYIKTNYVLKVWQRLWCWLLTC